MLTRIRTFVCAVFIFAGLGTSASANATVIEYQATNLSGNTWQYSYFVSGFDFLTNYSLSIFFDSLSYQNLQDPPISPAPALWDVISIQPDLLAPLDGEFDAFALVDHPSTAAPFTISFDWTGAGEPGTQLFSIFDGDFMMVDAGVTQPREVTPPPPVGIPDPSMAFLFGSGLLAFVVARKRLPLPK